MSDAFERLIGRLMECWLADPDREYLDAGEGQSDSGCECVPVVPPPDPPTEKPQQ